MLELYKGETKRPIEFTSGLDLDGQELYAEAYSDDGESYTLNSDDVTSIGNVPHEKSVMYIKSPTDMPTGNFYVKIFTDELVVSKDRLRHFGENPYDI